METGLHDSMHDIYDMKNLFFIFLSFFLISLPDATARRIRTEPKAPGKNVTDTVIEYMKGSQAISSECEDCCDGYTIKDVVFSGYDKKRSSEKESFFVTNRSDRTLTGFSLYIYYYTIDGRQLHKKYIRVNCLIAPGETEKTDIRSWDSQKSFYYVKSETNPRKGTPYTVSFDPVTIYLRYK